jgi:V/A-type H+-transporting ATPase subunit E
VTPRAGIEELEAALIARARALADEHLANARRTRDQILADGAERLRLREEREILAAKAAAERLYRQRVQAAEIKLAEELDRLRWSLVVQTLEKLRARLAALATDETRYEALLKRYVAQAAEAIERDDLVAELNARDAARAGKAWEAWCRDAGIGKRVRLAPEPIACAGGARVSGADGAIRIDNTFEGRLERMQEALQRTVMERLYASTADVRAMIGG